MTNYSNGSDSASFLLPWPPSINSVRMAIRGRIISSPRYRDWLDEASKHLATQEIIKFSGPVSVEIALGPPTKRKFDLDNHAKPCIDMLKEHGIIEEDNCDIIQRLTLTIDRSITGAMVTVEPIRFAVTAAGAEALKEDVARGAVA